MDSISKQIFIGIFVTASVAGAGTYITNNYTNGQRDHKIDSNTARIDAIERIASEVPILKVKIQSFERRLAAYEAIVVEGQKDILKEISSININNARTSARIESIESNLNDIKKRMEYK